MLALLLLAATASPPEILWAAWSPGGIVDVECAGFVNGDSTEDVFAASDEASEHGIMCLDGATGGIIWLNDSIPGITGTGCLRVIRDVNLDGVHDVAAGSSANPAVAVFSGSTGEILWSIPQEYPVCWIEASNGPGPSDVYVLVNRQNSYWTSCAALVGQTGAQQWATPYVATTDLWLRATEGDINGTGWSEFGISVDRGSVSGGWADVMDGSNGGLIHREGTMYFGSMDVCDTPMPLMVMSHFGTYPVTWAYSFVSGTVVWQSDNPDLGCALLQILPSITEPATPDREILGLGSSSHLVLFSCDEEYTDVFVEYIFPSAIRAVDYYCEAATWRVALVTSASFHCPLLDLWSPPSTEPSIALPNTDAQDLCLIESVLSPTPLVAVAMKTAGPGVCAIRTTWPEGIEEESTAPNLVLSSCSPSPGTGEFSLTWSSGMGLTEIGVYEESGRLCLDCDLGLMPEGDHSTQLDLQEMPSGCYLVVVSCGTERASTKLVVLR